MKTRILATALGFAALLVAPSAGAAIGAIDTVPAATLFYPYFEVDVGAGTSDTLISIQNSTATATLVNVTIWSEAGVPVQHFPLYLTGFDAQSISLRAILVNGTLPQTASAGQDPQNTISPQGAQSQDINFASCNGVLPLAALPAATITGLQAALTGKASSLLGNSCAGADHGDTLARGYVTVDTVNNCTARSPADAGYFGNDATDQNNLLGDFFLIDSASNHAQALPAVHIEASATDPATSTSGNYTFYGKYANWTAADHREPLATQWTVPFTTNETDVVVWRDTKVSQAAFACGSQPSSYPLNNEGTYAFDMQEGIVDLSAVLPFSTMLSRTRVGSAALPVTSKNGAIAFSSNTTIAGVPLPPVDPAAAQSFAFAIHYPGARNGASPYGTTIAATPTDTAVTPIHQLPANDIPVAFGGKPVALGVADVGPAASLLAPYFEVDTAAPNGVNTQIRLVNQYATAVLVHATLWTDYGIPTHRFNVYLTGYDESLIDLRWLFQKGLVDLTASAGQDPTDGISPHGNFSQDINFASCYGQLPPQRLSADAVSDLVKAHLGQGSARFSGKCTGAAHGDAIARGYVTFDVVNNCTQRVATDPGYFGAGGTGDVTNQNNISGTYTIVDRNQKLSAADTLVHLQASATDPFTSVPGNATFYGKFVGWTAADNREPLGTAWQTRFIAEAAAGSVFGAFADGKTNLLAWRESPQVNAAFTCGQTPTGFPLPLAGALQFDEQEHVTALGAAFNPFPLVTQRVPVTDPSLAAAYASGVYTFDLRAPVGALGGAPSDPARRGGFVSATHYAKAAGYEVLLGGFQLQ